MCGRFVSVSDPQTLAERFAVDEVHATDQGRRYNVAPTLDVYAVVAKNDARRLGTLRWGFVPHWSKGPKEGPSPINARLDGIVDNNMFARSFARRRCIVPADGFYEWTERDGVKQPWHIADPDERPLALAGIWTSWREHDDADPVASCAIVTTDAVGIMTELHDRMPVVLPERFWDTWLTADPDDTPHLHETLLALEPPALVAREVSTKVNSVRNDGPELLDPPDDHEQATLEP